MKRKKKKKGVPRQRGTLKKDPNYVPREKEFKGLKVKKTTSVLHKNKENPTVQEKKRGQGKKTNCLGGKGAGVKREGKKRQSYLHATTNPRRG